MLDTSVIIDATGVAFPGELELAISTITVAELDSKSIVPVGPTAHPVFPEALAKKKVATGEAAASTRTIVNWDVASSEWQSIKTRAEKNWDRLSSK